MKLFTVVVSLISVLLLLNILSIYLSHPISKETFLKKIYEEITHKNYEESEAWKYYLSTINYQPNFHKILADDDYCDSVKEYRLNNPVKLDSRGLPVHEDKIIYSNFPKWYFTKKTLIENYNVVYPEYYLTNVRKNKPAHLPLNITMFFHMVFNTHQFMEIGKHFVCPGQRYNHIPGNTYIDAKDESIMDLVKYSEQFSGRKQCFDIWAFTPYTLILSNEKECALFMQNLKENISQNELQWIYKEAKESNQGFGVKVVDKQLSSTFLEDFEKSGSCKSHSGRIAQKYISNPYLINGKKFDFRAYMFVASMDPLMVLYHDGFLRISVDEFNITSTDGWRHITNTGQAKGYFKANNYTSELISETLEDLGWMYPQFLDYLVERKDAGSDWLEKEFRPTIKSAIIHIMRSALHRLPRHPQLFELFGLDFIMDDNMKLWFIEANYDPGITSNTKAKEAMNSKMTIDIIELEYALGYNPSLFDEILNNTSFQWVIDERKKGVAKYHGLLGEDCL
ncbi:unnamed protein product [Blepharisma stoltei]|uniref:Tubulin-tyrosine ligase family protein n=1 Tax=Blepharisma stoltei TaxID=1481888 RepID=A0AAU9JK36_9CILI|nr:unnamed protein product [Blepharisma stoltei]